MTCGKDWKPESISTFWGCVPVPEQQAISFCAQFVPTPSSFVPIQTFIDILALYGAGNAQKRAEIILASPYITTIEQTPMVCDAEEGCIAVNLSPWIIDVYNGQLIGEFQIGAPVCPPCYFAPVMPS